MKCDILAHTSPTELRFVESHWIAHQMIFHSSSTVSFWTSVQYFLPNWTTAQHYHLIFTFLHCFFSLHFLARHLFFTSLFVHFTSFCTALFMHCTTFLCSLINCNNYSGDKFPKARVTAPSRHGDLSLEQNYKVPLMLITQCFASFINALELIWVRGSLVISTAKRCS